MEFRVASTFRITWSPLFYFPKTKQSPETLGDFSEFIRLVNRGALAKLVLCGPWLIRCMIWDGLWRTTFRDSMLNMQVRHCVSSGGALPLPREEDTLAERRICIDKMVGRALSLSPFQRMLLSVQSTLGLSTPKELCPYIRISIFQTLVLFKIFTWIWKLGP